MSRTLIVLAALLVSTGADAATVYKCRIHGHLSYQDRPCPGRDFSKNVVEVGDPMVVKNARADDLADFAEQAGQENRQRELQAKAARLQRENDADKAEFAAMVEDIDRQRSAAVQGVAQPADAPTVDELYLRQRQTQQEYADRVQQRNQQLQDVQAELDQYNQQR